MICEQIKYPSSDTSSGKEQKYPNARVQTILRLPTEFTELRRLSTSVVIGRRSEKSKVSILHQSELQKSHILQLAKNQEQIKMLSHDFKQKAETIRTLNESGKSNELTAYITEISNIQPTFIFIDTSDAMVDAILSSKGAEALRNSIDFSLKRTFYVYPNTYTHDVMWYASALVHEAVHARQFREYLESYGDRPPRRITFYATFADQMRLEMEALDFQIRFLEDAGASRRIIDMARSFIGTVWWR